MDIISLNTSIIYNLFSNWKNNKDKNIIIDPMACLIKLSILGFYPSGTKISIADNMINIIEYSLLQGTFRFFKGDGREDLHNLYIPIIKSIEWYWNENNEIKHLFDFAIKGIENLKSSYPINSTICHTLDLYTYHLSTKHTTTFNNKEITYDTVSQNDSSQNHNSSKNNNMIHDFLKKLWNEREIHIIIELLLEYNIVNNKNDFHIINTIIDLTNAKELKFKYFLKEHFASL